MKINFIITALLLSLLFICCNKTLDITGSESLLVGRWILVETLADPGNGSGQWTSVNKPDYYFLQFNKDNSIESNTYTGLGGLKQYNVINNSNVKFIYGNGDTMTLNYKINDLSLTLEGGCIESCGTKFKRKTTQH